MTRRNDTTFSHQEIRDILERLDTLIPENGYEASGHAGEKSCSVTYKFTEKRDVVTIGMPFYNFVLNAPLLAQALLVQLDDLMSRTVTATSEHGDYRELGAAAFTAGLAAIPTFDPAMAHVLTAEDAIPALSAWLKGWHAAYTEASVEP